MTALNTYRRWLARVEDDALRAELSALDEVRDAAHAEAAGEERKTSFAKSFTLIRPFLLSKFKISQSTWSSLFFFIVLLQSELL